MNKPALYASAHNSEVRDIQNIVDEFAEELGKMSGRCIDIGTGPGSVLVEFVLPKLDPKSTMVCSDISEDMLNFAKTKYGGNDRLSFVKLDITTRNFPNDLVGQFDHVTSIYCLHWCNDVRQAFRNMFTLLRPGGTVLLNFLSSGPFYDSWNDLAAMPRYEPFMKDKNTFVTIFHYDKQPTETLRKMIRDAGFDIGHLSARQEIHIYNDQDTLSDLLVSVNPFIDRMPADLRKKYKEDLVRTFLNQDTVFRKYNTKNECSTLFYHRVYVVYLKKPASAELEAQQHV